LARVQRAPSFIAGGTRKQSHTTDPFRHTVGVTVSTHTVTRPPQNDRARVGPIRSPSTFIPQSSAETNATRLDGALFWSRKRDAMKRIVTAAERHVGTVTAC